MEQFGILEVVNNLEEFSSSKVKQANARNNLLIDDLGLQDSDNVRIAGESKIQVDEFEFQSLNALGRYITSCNQHGHFSYSNFPLPEWLASYKQAEIGIGSFSNDLDYVQMQKIENNRFMFNEDIRYLVNRPTFEEIKTDFGHVGEFAVAASNLSSYDVQSSIQNLGIGDLATCKSNEVIVNNLTIYSNLQLNVVHHFSKTFLSNQDGSIVGGELDLHLKTNALSSNTSALPSSILLSNLTEEFHNTIIEYSASNEDFISSNEGEIKARLKADVLFTTDNFDVSPTEDAIMRCNLGIGDLSTQSVDDVKVDKITVMNIINTNSDKVYYDGRWMNHSNFIYSNAARSDKAGFAASEQLLHYNLAAATNRVLNSNIDAVESNITLDLRYFSSNLFELASNLSEITDTSKAISNLELHTVATSGSLADITGKPSHLSDLSNDATYLQRNQNLADIPEENRKNALKNIGVSDMAFEDANNIGGTATLPLGVGNRKFHSTDCKIDYVYVDKGKFFLRDLDQIGEVDDNERDFLVTEKYDVNTTGVINYKYRFKQIPRADETYFRGQFQLNPDDYVRVILNDLDNLNTRFETDLIQGFRDDIQDDYIFGDHHVPTCKFAYHKFSSMILSILDRFDIPIEYYDGGVSNL
tara:strand:- start:5108 stop:7033 length:1926 start_codon:yes stop_codon:yes gene_type:complete